MPAQNLCSALYTWQNGKHGYCIFTRCISCALPEFNQLLLDFFSLFDSRLILMLLYDSLNIVISAFSLGLWRHGSRESKSTALQQVDCVDAKSTSALSSASPLSQGNAGALDR